MRGNNRQRSHELGYMACDRHPARLHQYVGKLPLASAKAIIQPESRITMNPFVVELIYSVIFLIGRLGLHVLPGSERQRVNGMILVATGLSSPITTALFACMPLSHYPVNTTWALICVTQSAVLMVWLYRSFRRRLNQPMSIL
jgi:hypothetical protein